MPIITLKYLMDGDRPVLLLSEDERQRIGARIEEARRAADTYDAADLPGEATALRIQAAAMEEELAIDGDLAGDSDVRSVRIAFSEPTLADLEAVRGKIADLGAAKQVAYERLKPAVVEGWEGEGIPLRFYSPVADACYAAIDPNPSEDRRFFSRRRRAGTRDI